MLPVTEPPTSTSQVVVVPAGQSPPEGSETLAFLPGAPPRSSSPSCSSPSTASGAAGVLMWDQLDRSLTPCALMALMR